MSRQRKCTIKPCDRHATVRVTLDRPERTDGFICWTGHLENDYCGVHAALRVAYGESEHDQAFYGDVWTLTPLRALKVKA